MKNRLFLSLTNDDVKQKGSSFFKKQKLLEFIFILIKGSFRIQQFCCNQQLMQCIVINWKKFYFIALLQSTAILQWPSTSPNEV